MQHAFGYVKNVKGLQVVLRKLQARNSPEKLRRYLIANRVAKPLKHNFPDLLLRSCFGHQAGEQECHFQGLRAVKTGVDGSAIGFA